MKEDLEEKIVISEGIEVHLNDNNELVIKGPKGELKRSFPIKITIKEKNIILSNKKSTKREKNLLRTSIAHINNMMKGVIEGFNYKLQICSVHFPMNVSILNNEVIIKNFLGESKERKAKVLPNVDIKLEGDFIQISSIDKEAAGQTAATLEAKTRVRNKDRRIFQDGIWIIEKPHKKYLE